VEAETVTRPATVADPGVATPPLEPGDHLTRDEFERRYDAMPGLKKVELVEGVVYMSSPVRWNQHARPHVDVLTWLRVYAAHTPGVQVGDNVSVRLDGDNMPQPDAAMIIDPARGGQAAISEDDYIEGAPELVVEVAASSASIDLNTKLRVYRRNRVREYLVWRVLDAAIDWFVLRQGQFERLAPGPDGIYRSEVFPGLWLDASAFAASDLLGVLDVLRRGIGEPEHAGFVDRLAGAARG
jgi:Uma2 family endonuclease